MEYPQHPANHASPTSASCSDRLITLLTQHVAPHHALTRLMYTLTRAQQRHWKNWQIRWFIKRYQVDMSIALEPDPFTHRHFNSFFTRALKPGARPVVNGSHDIACPVDGTVSQVGPIRDGRIFQAKGQDYSLETLLGGSAERAAPFQGGTFATLYLSPKDYHRIHMPLAGQLQEMTYVPGRLFSVSPRTTRCVTGLFARNERLVTIFETPAGPMALVLVGAMFVAGIETVWSGPLHAQTTDTLKTWDYRASDIALKHGEEMGRFNMGSTVIVLFGPNRVDLAPTIQPDAPIQMGQLLGNYKRPD